ncbi:hypothetical protein PCE1_000237 [Barthelona sp. PCE]
MLCFDQLPILRTFADKDPDSVGVRCVLTNSPGELVSSILDSVIQVSDSVICLDGALNRVFTERTDLCNLIDFVVGDLDSATLLNLEREINVDPELEGGLLASFASFLFDESARSIFCIHPTSDTIELQFDFPNVDETDFEIIIKPIDFELNVPEILSSIEELIVFFVPVIENSTNSLIKFIFNQGLLKLDNVSNENFSKFFENNQDRQKTGQKQSSFQQNLSDDIIDIVLAAEVTSLEAEQLLNYANRLFDFVSNLLKKEHTIDIPTDECRFWNTRYLLVKEVLRGIRDPIFVKFMKHVESIDANLIQKIKHKVRELSDFFSEVDKVNHFLKFVSPFFKDLETSTADEFQGLCKVLSFYASEHNLNIILSSVASQTIDKSLQYLEEDCNLDPQSFFTVDVHSRDSLRLNNEVFNTFTDNAINIVARIRTTIGICNFLRQSFFRYRNERTSQDSAWVRLRSVDAFGNLNNFVDRCAATEELLLRFLEFSTFRNLTFRGMNLNYNEWNIQYNQLLDSYKLNLVTFLKKLYGISPTSTFVRFNLDTFNVPFSELRKEIIHIDLAICSHIHDRLSEYNSRRLNFQFISTVQVLLHSKPYYLVSRLIFFQTVKALSIFAVSLHSSHLMLKKAVKLLNVESSSFVLYEPIIPNCTVSNDQPINDEVFDSLVQTDPKVFSALIRLYALLMDYEDTFSQLDMSYLSTHTTDEIPTRDELKKLAVDLAPYVNSAESLKSADLIIDSAVVPLVFYDEINRCLRSQMELAADLQLTFIQLFTDYLTSNENVIRKFYSSPLLCKNHSMICINCDDNASTIFYHTHKFVSLLENLVVHKNGVNIGAQIYSRVPSIVSRTAKFFKQFHDVSSVLSLSCRKYNCILPDLVRVLENLLMDELNKTNTSVFSACNDIVWQAQGSLTFCTLFDTTIDVLAKKAEALFTVIRFIEKFFDNLSEDNRIFILALSSDLNEILNANVSHFHHLQDMFEDFNAKLCELVENARKILFLTQGDNYWLDFLQYLQDLLVRKVTELLTITLQQFHSFLDTQESGTFLIGKLFLRGEFIFTIPDSHVGGSVLSLLEKSKPDVLMSSKSMASVGFSEVEYEMSEDSFTVYSILHRKPVVDNPKIKLDVFVDTMLTLMLRSFAVLKVPRSLVGEDGHFDEYELKTPRINDEAFELVEEEEDKIESNSVIMLVRNNTSLNALIRRVYSNIANFAQLMLEYISDKYSTFGVLFDSVKLQQTLKLDTIASVVDDIERKSDGTSGRLSKFKVVANREKFFKQLEPKLDLLEQVSDLVYNITNNDVIMFVTYDLSAFKDSMQAKFSGVVFKLRKLLSNTLSIITTHIYDYLTYQLEQINDMRRSLEKTDGDQRIITLQDLTRRIRDLKLNEKRLKSTIEFCTELVQLFEHHSSLQGEQDTVNHANKCIVGAERLTTQLDNTIQVVQTQVSRSMGSFVQKVEANVIELNSQLEQFSNRVFELEPFGNVKCPIFSTEFNEGVTAARTLLTELLSEAESLASRRVDISGYLRLISTKSLQLVTIEAAQDMLSEYDRMWNLFEAMISESEEFESISFEEVNLKDHIEFIEDCIDSLEEMSENVQNVAGYFKNNLQELLRLLNAFINLKKRSFSDYYWQLLSNSAGSHFSNQMSFSVITLLLTFFDNESGFIRLKEIIQEAKDEETAGVILSSLESDWLLKQISLSSVALDCRDKCLFRDAFADRVPHLLINDPTREHMLLFNLPYFSDLSFMSDFEFKSSPWAQALHFPELLKGCEGEVVCRRLPIFEKLNSSLESIAQALSLSSSRLAGRMRSWSISLQQIRRWLVILFNTSAIWETLFFCSYEYSKYNLENNKLYRDIADVHVRFLNFQSKCQKFRCILDSAEQNIIEEARQLYDDSVSLVKKIVPHLQPEWVSRAVYLGYVSSMSMATSTILVQKLRVHPDLFSRVSAENFAIQHTYCQLGPNSNGFEVEGDYITHLIDQANILVPFDAPQAIFPMDTVERFFGGFMSAFVRWVRNEWQEFIKINPDMLVMTVEDFWEKLESFDGIIHPIYMCRFHLQHYLKHITTNDEPKVYRAKIKFLYDKIKLKLSSIYVIDDGSIYAHYRRIITPYLGEFSAVDMRYPSDFDRKYQSDLPCRPLDFSSTMTRDFVIPESSVDMSLTTEHKLITPVRNNAEAIKPGEFFINEISYKWADSLIVIDGVELKHPHTITANLIAPVLTPDLFKVMRMMWKTFSWKRIVLLHGDMINILPELRIAFLFYCMSPFYIFDCVSLAQEFTNLNGELLLDEFLDRLRPFIPSAYKTGTIACFKHFHKLPVIAQGLVSSLFHGSDCRTVFCCDTPNFVLPEDDYVAINLDTHFNHSGSSLLYLLLDLYPYLEVIPFTYGFIHQVSLLLDQIYWLLRAYGILVFFNSNNLRRIMAGTITLFKHVCSVTTGVASSSPDVQFVYVKRVFAYVLFQFLEDAASLNNFTQLAHNVFRHSLFDIKSILSVLENFAPYYQNIENYKMQPGFNFWTNMVLNTDLYENFRLLNFMIKFSSKLHFNDMVVLYTYTSSLVDVRNSVIQLYSRYLSDYHQNDEHPLVIKHEILNSNELGSDGEVVLHAKNESFRIASAINEEVREMGFVDTLVDLPNVLVVVYCCDAPTTFLTVFKDSINYAVSNCFYFRCEVNVKFVSILTNHSPVAVNSVNRLSDSIKLHTKFSGIKINTRLIPEPDRDIPSYPFIANQEVIFMDPVYTFTESQGAKISDGVMIGALNHVEMSDLSLRFGKSDAIGVGINSLVSMFQKASHLYNPFTSFILPPSSRLHNIWTLLDKLRDHPNKLQAVVWLMYVYGHRMGVNKSSISNSVRSFIKKYEIAVEGQAANTGVDNMLVSGLSASLLVNEEMTSRSGHSMGHVSLKLSGRKSSHRKSAREMDSARDISDQVILEGVEMNNLEKSYIKIGEPGLHPNEKMLYEHIFEIFFSEPDAIERHPIKDGKTYRLFFANYDSRIHSLKLIDEVFAKADVEVLRFRFDIYPSTTAYDLQQALSTFIPHWSRNLIAPASQKQHYWIIFDNIQFATSDVLLLIQNVSNSNVLNLPKDNLNIRFERTSFCAIGHFDMPISKPISDDLHSFVSHLDGFFTTVFPHVTHAMLIDRAVQFLVNKWGVTDSAHVSIIRTTFEVFKFLLVKFKTGLKQSVASPTYAFSEKHIWLFASVMVHHKPNPAMFGPSLASFFIFLLRVIWLSRLQSSRELMFANNLIEQAITHFYSGDIIQHLPSYDTLCVINIKTAMELDAKSQSHQKMINDDIYCGDFVLVARDDLLRFRLFRALHEYSPQKLISLAPSEMLFLLSMSIVLNTPNLHLTLIKPISLDAMNFLSFVISMFVNINKKRLHLIKLELGDTNQLFEIVKDVLINGKSTIVVLNQFFWLRCGQEPLFSNRLTAALLDSFHPDTKFNALISQSLLFTDDQREELTSWAERYTPLGMNTVDFIKERVSKNLTFVNVIPPSLFIESNSMKQLIPIFARTVVVQHQGYSKSDFVQVVSDLIIILDRQYRLSLSPVAQQGLSRILHRSLMDFKKMAHIVNSRQREDFSHFFANTFIKLTERIQAQIIMPDTNRLSFQPQWAFGTVTAGTFDALGLQQFFNHTVENFFNLALYNRSMTEEKTQLTRGLLSYYRWIETAMNLCHRDLTHYSMTLEKTQRELDKNIKKLREEHQRKDALQEESVKFQTDIKNSEAEYNRAQSQLDECSEELNNAKEVFNLVVAELHNLGERDSFEMLLLSGENQHLDELSCIIISIVEGKFSQNAAFKDLRNMIIRIDHFVESLVSFGATLPIILIEQLLSKLDALDFDGPMLTRSFCPLLGRYARSALQWAQMTQNHEKALLTHHEATRDRDMMNSRSQTNTQAIESNTQRLKMHSDALVKNYHYVALMHHEMSETRSNLMLLEKLLDYLALFRNICPEVDRKDVPDTPSSMWSAAGPNTMSDPTSLSETASDPSTPFIVDTSFATPAKMVNSIEPVEEEKPKRMQTTPEYLLHAALVAMMPLITCLDIDSSVELFHSCLNDLVSKQLIVASDSAAIHSDKAFKHALQLNIEVIREYILDAFVPQPNEVQYPLSLEVITEVYTHVHTTKLGGIQFDDSVEVMESIDLAEEMDQLFDGEGIRDNIATSRGSKTQRSLPTERSITSVPMVSTTRNTEKLDMKQIAEPKRVAELFNRFFTETPFLSPLLLQLEEFSPFISTFYGERVISIFDPFDFSEKLINSLFTDVNYIGLYKYSSVNEQRDALINSVCKHKVTVIKDIDLLISLAPIILDILHVIKNRTYRLMVGDNRFDFVADCKVIIQCVQPLTHTSFLSSGLSDFPFINMDCELDSLIEVVCFDLCSHHDPDLYGIAQNLFAVIFNAAREETRLEREALQYVVSASRQLNVEMLEKTLSVFSEKCKKLSDCRDSQAFAKAYLLAVKNRVIRRYKYYAHIVGSGLKALVHVMNRSKMFYLIPNLKGVYKIILDAFKEMPEGKVVLDSTIRVSMLNTFIENMFTRIPSIHQRMVFALKFCTNLYLIAEEELDLFHSLLQAPDGFDMMTTYLKDMVDSSVFDAIEDGLIDHWLNAEWIDLAEMPDELKDLPLFVCVLLIVSIKPDLAFFAARAFLYAHNLHLCLGENPCSRFQLDGSIDFGFYKAVCVSSRYTNVFLRDAPLISVDEVTDEFLNETPLFGIASCQLDAPRVLNVLERLDNNKVFIICDVHQFEEMSHGVLKKCYIANDPHLMSTDILTSPYEAMRLWMSGILWGFTMHAPHFDLPVTQIFPQSVPGLMIICIEALSLMNVIPRIGGGTQKLIYEMCSPRNHQDLTADTYTELLENTFGHQHLPQICAKVIKLLADEILPVYPEFSMKCPLTAVPPPQIIGWLRGPLMVLFARLMQDFGTSSDLVVNEALYHLNMMDLLLKTPSVHVLQSEPKLSDRLQNVVTFVSQSLVEKLSISISTKRKLEGGPIGQFLLTHISVLRIIRDELTSGCNSILDSLHGVKPPCSRDVYNLMLLFLNDRLPGDILALLNPTSEALNATYFAQYPKAQANNYPLHIFIPDFRAQMLDIRNLVDKIDNASVDIDINRLIMDHEFFARANPLLSGFILQLVTPRMAIVDYDFDLVIVMKHNLRPDIIRLVESNQLSSVLCSFDQYPILNCKIDEKFIKGESEMDSYEQLRITPSMVGICYLPLMQMRYCPTGELEKHNLQVVEVPTILPIKRFLPKLQRIVIVDAVIEKPFLDHSGLVHLGGWAYN